MMRLNHDGVAAGQKARQSSCCSCQPPLRFWLGNLLQLGAWCTKMPIAAFPTIRIVRCVTNRSGLFHVTLLAASLIACSRSSFSICCRRINRNLARSTLAFTSVKYSRKSSSGICASPAILTRKLSSSTMANCRSMSKTIGDVAASCPSPMAPLSPSGHQSRTAQPRHFCFSGIGSMRRFIHVSVSIGTGALAAGLSSPANKSIASGMAAPDPKSAAAMPALAKFPSAAFA